MKIQALLSRQFLLYLTGGLLSALIDIGILQLMIRAGINPWLSATAGFFVGLLFNFLFHANLTFRSATSLRSFIQYLVVVGLNYSITLLFIYISYSLMHEGVLSGKIVSLPVIAANGYLLGKYWIFK